MITSIIQSEETKLSDLTANLRLFDEQDIKYCTQPNSSVQIWIIFGLFYSLRLFVYLSSNYEPEGSEVFKFE